MTPRHKLLYGSFDTSLVIEQEHSHAQYEEENISPIFCEDSFHEPIDVIDQERNVEDEFESDQQSIDICIDLDFGIDNEDYDPYTRIDILEDEFENN